MALVFQEEIQCSHGAVLFRDEHVQYFYDTAKRTVSINPTIEDVSILITSIFKAYKFDLILN
jgi:hypothetical protein